MADKEKEEISPRFRVTAGRRRGCGLRFDDGDAPMVLGDGGDVDELQNSEESSGA
jgi:hypothetical protein